MTSWITSNSTLNYTKTFLIKYAKFLHDIITRHQIRLYLLYETARLQQWNNNDNIQITLQLHLDDVTEQQQQQKTIRTQSRLDLRVQRSAQWSDRLRFDASARTSWTSKGPPCDTLRLLLAMLESCEILKWAGKVLAEKGSSETERLVELAIK